MTTRSDTDDETVPAPAAKRSSVTRGKRMLAYAVLPGLALAITAGAGYLKQAGASMHDSERAGVTATRTAAEGTVAILSYRPDSVDHELNAARDRLTGPFKDSYTTLIRDVVIPGSTEKRIAANASVPAAAPVSVSDRHAVVLLFVDQTTTVGNDPPTQTASRVRVTLDNVDGRWLIAGFDPI